MLLCCYVVVSLLCVTLRCCYVAMLLCYYDVVVLCCVGVKLK